MLGTTLGAYRIEKELGRGGMGAVYTAVHTLLGWRAAVKVLAELSKNQDLVQRFFNEARAATAIKHFDTDKADKMRQRCADERAAGRSR